MAVNSATVIGNLDGDPQTRSVPSGDSVTNFSLATTERFKDCNGKARMPNLRT
jgi:single-strand DNA-binding protein